ECERVSDASLGQSLMLLNSAEVQGKLAAPGGRTEALIKDTMRTDEQKVAELFWAAFGRAPSSSETASALHHLEAHKDKKREAYEDILWALINAKEFQFND
ncbi:MAG: S-layer protein, partial [Isosphaeraceae bacterium]|nr:S-layer protein [Isosphaeraceae bacterium]